VNCSSVGQGYSGLVRIAVLVLVALAALTGCGTDDQTTTAPSQTTATTETPAPSGRELAPALAGTTLEGEVVALEDFRGRPLLVNVWSSW